jgi:transcriptional regulator with XRE-family HTH domain
MDFAEKLSRLTEEKNKQKLSNAAGLPATAVSDYIAKGSIPRADKALALARALNVPLEWLVDDAQEWPPPTQQRQEPTDLSDSQLLVELVRRRRLAQIDFWEAIELAEQVDWRRFKRDLEAVHEGAPIPRELVRLSNIPYAIHASLMRLMRFSDLTAVEQAVGAKLPTGGHPVEALDQKRLEERRRQLWTNKSFQSALKAIQRHPRTAEQAMEHQMREWVASVGGVFALKSTNAADRTRSPGEVRYSEG